MLHLHRNVYASNWKFLNDSSFRYELNIFFYPYRDFTDNESESGLSTVFKSRKIPEAKYNWK